MKSAQRTSDKAPRQQGLVTQQTTSLGLTFDSSPPPPPHPYANIMPTPRSLSVNLYAMQKAIPYRTWIPPSSANATSAAADGEPQQGSNVGKLVAENAVIVFGRRGCCMCHVVKRLLLGLGVNPPVVEVDEIEEESVIEELSRIGGGSDGGGGRVVQFPAIFVGGYLFGGLERVMATHISGELVPILKEAGALWL